MKRSGHPKRMNEYAEVLGELYRRTPKAVFAAIAVSSLTMGGDRLAEAKELLTHEWLILHQNRIVKQGPLK